MYFIVVQHVLDGFNYSDYVYNNGAVEIGHKFVLVYFVCFQKNMYDM